MGSLSLSLSLETKAYTAYRNRMGQWRKDVFLLTTTPLFWLCLKVFFICHAPLDHHQNFMQSVGRKGHIARLVCGKAAEIAGNFETVLLTTNWSEMEDVLPIEKAPEVLFLAVALTLNMSAGYNRRVVQQLLDRPARQRGTDAPSPPPGRNFARCVELSCQSCRSILCHVPSVSASHSLLHRAV
eukprot:6706618-Heterocapsa_arctica.AAC.1